VGKIAIEKSMSLDGFITGPNPTPENPLGDGGGDIFGWMMAPQPEEPKADGTRDLSEEYEQEIGGHLDATGAVIMGKRMWENIYGPNGWVAPDGTAFPWPVFVLTHEEREPETCGITRFTYVNDGAESALEQAKAVAGEKNIGIAGGNVCQQFIAKGLVDEVVVHLVPVFLGDGVRLFDHIGGGLQFEIAGAKPGNGVVHLSFRMNGTTQAQA
jgi:dihydrofolate reductase